MRNEKNANSCLFGEEIVAYVYNELELTERSVFEDHLLNCGVCTTELADVSLSRLGVYEWHRDEFVPLATPHFSVPYAPAPVANSSSVSFFESIRAFASPFRIAFAGGALAAMFVAVGLIFMAGGNADTKITAEGSDSVPPVESPMIAERNETISKPIVASLPADEKANVREHRAHAPARKLNAVQAKATITHKAVGPITTSAQSAPRLGNFTDPEDTSLRLSDLVADIDTRDF
jgi:hypothetical protein